MKLFKHFSLILTFLILLKLFQGCNNFQQQIILFELNKLTISNLDNSGLYLQQSVNDTMHSEAVAFRISVSDTSGMIGLAAKKYAEIGISSCMANEPEPSFKPAQMIENISVVSLFDVSDSVKANTDVTTFFCFNMDDYSVPGDIYLTRDQLIELMAGWSYDNQMLSFDLFLKENVMAENSQFIISLSLSDGRTLQDTTALITIIN